MYYNTVYVHCEKNTQSCTRSPFLDDFQHSIEVKIKLQFKYVIKKYKYSVNKHVNNALLHVPRLKHSLLDTNT